jgi:antitoxin VapB
LDWFGATGLDVVRRAALYEEEVCYEVYTSSMALSIKSDEADRLARELAAETGETLTEAVETALRERLDREHARHAVSMSTRLKRLAADVAAMAVADDRTPEEIIGYDDAGLPR